VISSVRGQVIAISSQSAVIEVGGLGISVSCGPRALARLRLGAMASVPTTLVVREDSLTLFGFLDDEERGAFEVLQSVSGVGPRTAQAILAVLTVAELQAAVAADDLATLSRPPGIGRKGAARIALELKDKLTPAADTPAAPAADPWSSQVVDGLIALGWPLREARTAMEAVRSDAQAALDSGETPSVPALLRAALRQLDRA
jgi:holliday junction DNA helicase RuvA